MVELERSRSAAVSGTDAAGFLVDQFALAVGGGSDVVAQDKLIGVRDSFEVFVFAVETHHDGALLNRHNSRKRKHPTQICRGLPPLLR